MVLVQGKNHFSCVSEFQIQFDIMSIKRDLLKRTELLNLYFQSLNPKLLTYSRQVKRNAEMNENLRTRKILKGSQRYHVSGQWRIPTLDKRIGNGTSYVQLTLFQLRKVEGKIQFKTKHNLVFFVPNQVTRERLRRK